MFEQLLTGIFDERALACPDEQTAYLIGLQGAARSLWESYRCQDVVVDYSSIHTQNVYLLRYFPFYAQLVPQVLIHLEDEGAGLADVQLLQAYFFGCGPAPELVGLLQHLRTQRPYTEMVSASLVDIRANVWRHGRSIGMARIAAAGWDRELLDCDSIEVCLTDVNLIAKLDPSNCHLLVFQNCLNEIHNKAAVIANIQLMLEISPVGAIAIIIDRSGYESTDSALQELLAWADQASFVQAVGNRSLAKQRFDCNEILQGVPDIITTNLLHRWGDQKPNGWDYDKLIFSKKISYVSLAFQRVAIAA